MSIEEVNSDLEHIFLALKVKNVEQALQKIEMFTTWNQQDVKVISQLRKEISDLKSKIKNEAGQNTL